jgi:hypothetical protein
MSSNSTTNVALDILQLQISSQQTFLVLSFILLIADVLGNLLNILNLGYQIDFTVTNRACCKVRSGSSDVNGQITLSLFCLPSVDGFLCSSTSATVR